MLLIVLILVDTGVGYRLWNSGWPKRVIITSVEPGIEQVQVVSVPLTGTDWLILILVIGTHAALLFLVWKAWRPAPVRV
jgi:hypothetical protein